jgi:hypothetical protein
MAMYINSLHNDLPFPLQISTYMLPYPSYFPEKFSPVMTDSFWAVYKTKGGNGMNRWIVFLLSGLFAFSLTACSPDNRGENHGNHQGMENQSDEEPLYREQNNDTRIGRTSNDSINGNEEARGGGQNEIGYFKYTPQNYDEKSAGKTDVFVDRPLLARHIAEMVTNLPNVKEATALVTDDRVFIGVNTKNGKVDPKTVKEAKRTAESLTPRYYRVHVTSDKNLNEKITDIGMRMSTNNDVEGVRGDLEDLLRRLGDDTPPDVNEQIEPNGLRDINPLEK